MCLQVVFENIFEGWQIEADKFDSDNVSLCEK